VDVEAAIGIVALVIALSCVMSGAYVYSVYRQRHEEALFLTRLVHRDIRVSAASAVIAGIIAVAYLAEPLPRPWSGLLIGGALIVMMLGPVSDALLWRKERRRPKGDLRQSAFTENRDVAGAQMANDHLTDEQKRRFDA
jgi:uncharacterized membrane protein YfcA